eukprot:CAMPEP_0119293282 /NCGR_PEP_ID=MMETSP1329-20130426/45772_1 /TAXON_ID=114041 /ORGANISM="Genus nov. species nov., Strain RCC1024" /LENGTH=359 /DNA_ID=CAMNT_0007294145 /DNA_START=59 /DNA_END=1135 /DNA_ORIENTATION=+
MTVEEMPPEELCLIDYSSLVGGTDDAAIGKKIAKAFGPDGLGVLAVTDVPKEVSKQRIKLLELGRRLGTLPEETLARYERPELHYCAGWSRGREKFKGKLDTAKGSWYANGLYEDAAEGSQDLKARYPESTTEPEWPGEDVVGGDLRGAFRALSRSLYDMSLHVLRHCDAAACSALKAKGLEAPPDALTAVTHARSRLHIGRLLHYYPRQADPSKTGDAAWCGWHNDNSVITALAPAIYFNDATGERVGAPRGGGLMAYSRTGVKTKVPAPPEDSILFQIGEAAQVISGGCLVATPHAVAPGDLANISREAFALFIEPGWDEPMQVPEGCGLGDVLAPDDDRADIIPPLRKRLKEVPVA